MSKVDDFFKHIEGIVKYWEKIGKDKAHVADGVAFSFLVMLDGGSSFEHEVDLLIDGKSIYTMEGVGELHEDERYHHMKPVRKMCEACQTHQNILKEGEDEKHKK